MIHILLHEDHNIAISKNDAFTPDLLKSRSSHRRCTMEKDVPKKLATFTGKHLCWSLHLIKLKALFWKRKNMTPLVLKRHFF